MPLSSALLSAAFLLVSLGGSSIAESASASWFTERVEFSALEHIGLEEVPAGTIERVRANYEFSPWSACPVEEVVLWRALVDPSSGETVLMFDCAYMSDTAIVYRVDENGEIRSRHLYNSWQ